MSPANPTSRLITFLLFVVMTLSACGGGDTNGDGKKAPTKKEIAIEKIMSFAEDQSGTAPTLQDYVDAGVTGVTGDTLSDLNTLVADLNPNEVDTTSELETLTSQLSINIAPTANAGNDLTVQMNVEIVLEGSGNDLDGDIVSYVWKKGSTVLANSQILNYTPSTVGTETITLTVTDNDHAIGSDDITITVVPVPTATNKTPIANAGANKTVEVNKGVQLKGTGTDSDGTIIGYEWKKGSTVLSNKADFTYTPTTVGKDTLTLIVKDNGGLTATSTTEITVTQATAPDTTSPTLQLLGTNPVDVEQGTVYTDAGVTAVDNKDGTITNSVVKSGDTVNTSASIGTEFSIIYNVSDAAGNPAVQITRTVKIIAPIPDTVDPIITLIGNGTLDVIQGLNYTDAGATANDDRDGNITADIQVGGDAVNTNAAIGSTFTITYNVKDAALNSAIEVTRTVSIIEDTQQIPNLSAGQIAEYLAVINTARAEARVCGSYGNYVAVAPVTWSDQLYRAAYEHSQDLAVSNTFAHLGSGTLSDWTGYANSKQSSPSERVDAYGYNWARISENISAGTIRDTAQEAIDSWLVSPGHCVNVMDPNVTQVGMALFSNATSTYTNYWTQNFARPF